MPGELKYKDITEKIISASFEVHKFLGNGFQEPLKDSSFKMNSVKSINPCKSVIQTIYDIVKAHGGDIKVETKEGEGAEFMIKLPAM